MENTTTAHLVQQLHRSRQPRQAAAHNRHLELGGALQHPAGRHPAGGAAPGQHRSTAAVHARRAFDFVQEQRCCAGLCASCVCWQAGHQGAPLLCKSSCVHPRPGRQGRQAHEAGERTGRGASGSLGNSDRRGTSFKPTSFTLPTSDLVGACTAWLRTACKESGWRHSGAGSGGWQCCCGAVFRHTLSRAALHSTLTGQASRPGGLAARAGGLHWPGARGQPACGDRCCLHVGCSLPAAGGQCACRQGCCRCTVWRWCSGASRRWRKSKYTPVAALVARAQ